MPKSSPAKLKWQKAYNHRPENIKKRSANNKARREMAHIVGLSDLRGKDVAHKKALDNGGGNNPSNLSLQDVKTNRGWRKGRHGYKVPNV